MGKNKTPQEAPEDMSGKTHELERTRRISKGFFKNNPTKSK